MRPGAGSWCFGLKFRAEKEEGAEVVLLNPESIARRAG